jgi:arsenate reductase
MKTVLFICVANSGRSQMAEAFTRQFSGGRVKAISAGTMPSSSVDPVVAKLMKEIGVSMDGQKPKMLTMDMVSEADRVITMGCGVSTEGVCPATFVPSEDWGLDDPKGKPEVEIKRIRDDIKTRVEQLLEKI